MAETSMMFFLVHFTTEICICFISIRFYFSLYVFIIISINWLAISFFIDETANIPHISMYLLSNYSSLALKDISLLLSKHLACPII